MDISLTWHAMAANSFLHRRKTKAERRQALRRGCKRPSPFPPLIISHSRFRPSSIKRARQRTRSLLIQLRVASVRPRSFPLQSTRVGSGTHSDRPYRTSLRQTRVVRSPAMIPSKLSQSLPCRLPYYPASCDCQICRPLSRLDNTSGGGRADGEMKCSRSLAVS